MGAWGHGSFDNDDAGDWLLELAGADPSFLSSTLAEALREGRYLEAPTCCTALAAAEVVAALGGRPATDLPVEATEWVRGRPQASGDVVAAARDAVARVRTESELRELWEETEDFEAWLASTGDILERLGGKRTDG